jgi:hypothetical protein
MAKGPDWNDVHRANPGAVRDALTEPDIPFDDAPLAHGNGQAYLTEEELRGSVYPPNGPSDDPRTEGTRRRVWPEPDPLPSGLLPVASFDPAFLPAAIAPWVLGIARRMQCPLDFVGVAAIAALGSVLGRKIGVRPKQHDDWTCVPNFWSMIIGSPGSMKSPAIEKVLAPVRYLEKEASSEYSDAKAHFDNQVEFFNLEVADAKKKAAKCKLKGFRQAYEEIAPSDKPVEPKQHRYLTSDTSYEKLGMMLVDNPTGLLAYRES